MAEPRTEWGRELKAQTESLTQEIATLQQEVTSLTHALKECSEVVRETISEMGEMRQFRDQVTARLDRHEQKLDEFTRFQDRTRTELAWLKWILGIGTTGLIAIGIFVATSLFQLSTTTAKLESTLQHLQLQPKN